MRTGLGKSHNQLQLGNCIPPDNTKLTTVDQSSTEFPGKSETAKCLKGKCLAIQTTLSRIYTHTQTRDFIFYFSLKKNLKNFLFLFLNEKRKKSLGRKAALE